MSTWIITNNWIIMTISISIQWKRIFIFTYKGIPTNKSACCRVIISRPQINSSRFLVVVFTTVTESIRIWIINILFNAESIICVSFSNFTLSICKIYNIAVSVLGMVGILWLIAVFVIVLRNKICTSDVAVFLF